MDEYVKREVTFGREQSSAEAVRMLRQIAADLEAGKVSAVGFTAAYHEPISGDGATGCAAVWVGRATDHDLGTFCGGIAAIGERFERLLEIHEDRKGMS